VLSAASVWLIGRYASTRFAKSWLRLTSWISVRQIGHWEERLSASDQHWRDGRGGRNTVPPSGYSTEGAKMVREQGGGGGLTAAQRLCRQGTPDTHLYRIS
jgi:hypothetical protein